MRIRVGPLLFREILLMSVWFRARSFLTTITFAGALSLALSPAQADDGRVQFTVLKAGLIIGGSGGSGSFSFKGRRYALSIGGLSYGFTFGASQTNFRGIVSNIRRPQDVEGVYVAGSAGAALGRGAQVIVLTNQNGAVLSLSGRSVGAIVSADLNGLALSLSR